LASYTIRVLVVSGNYLFAGTNSGLFRSSDNGTTWTTIENGLTEGNIYALVAIGSDLFVGNLGGGVFHSTDNGDSWTPANIGLTSSYIHVLTEIGSDPSSAMLFAGTTDQGVFLSTNNGVSWNSASTGLPANTYVQDLIVSGTNLFVSTFDSAVYLSTDDGTSWQHVSSGITDTNVYTLAVCDTTLFAGTIHGVWRRSISDFNNSSVSPIASIENSLRCYPNPFSSSTTINFTTPESGVATVAMVNILGTEVAHLFSGELSAGEHSFTWDATGLPPGMYECIVQMNGSVQPEATIKN
jgi:ligand-binding sensor domain-containing protein